MSAATTVAPAPSNASQCCRPRRPAAPVTIATFPASENISVAPAAVGRLPGYARVNRAPCENRFHGLSQQTGPDASLLHRSLHDWQHVLVRPEYMVYIPV